MTCPRCGSENIEKNDPRAGEHTCRDCGEWIEEDDPWGWAEVDQFFHSLEAGDR